MYKEVAWDSSYLYKREKTVPAAAVDCEGHYRTMTTTYYCNSDESRGVVTGSILDLPIGILLDVSEYLSKPSKALLAVALTASTSQASWKKEDINLQPQLSEISTAIISPSLQWQTLDFSDVDKSLSENLSDDDIAAVLTCINAKDTLKKLILTGLVNIVGHGLYPLRGSNVLEQVDLSLASKYENPDIQTKPKISYGVILPILESIIATTGFSLKYIQFPQKWRSENQCIREFIEKYNRHFQSRDLISCVQCNTCMHHNETWLSENMYHYNTCYDCLSNTCDKCEHSNNDSRPFRLCYNCKKDYCFKCLPMKDCVGCDEQLCDRCMRTCGKCSRPFCTDCLVSVAFCNICLFCVKDMRSYRSMRTL